MVKLKVPETRNYEYGYDLAYKLVRERLGEVSLKEQCLRSGARLEGDGAVLDYLDQSYRITLPRGVQSLTGGEDLKPRDKILVLHYFVQAKGTPASGRLIAYKEIPSAGIYFRTFSKRALKPLLDNFGKKPEKLFEAGSQFAAAKASVGDASITIPAFSRVPLTIVLWRGDEEFPPEANILFDSNITDYLALEDINVLCETVAWRLVKTQKQQ